MVATKCQSKHFCPPTHQMPDTSQLLGSVQVLQGLCRECILLLEAARCILLPALSNASGTSISPLVNGPSGKRSETSPPPPLLPVSDVEALTRRAADLVSSVDELEALGESLAQGLRPPLGGDGGSGGGIGAALEAGFDTPRSDLKMAVAILT